MKKNIHLILLSLTVIFTCCNRDFLDKEPLDEITNDQFWQTTENLSMYTMRWYESFPYFNGGLGDYGNNSDDVIANQYDSWMNGDKTLPESGGGWDWGDIRDVNIFFANYKKCKDPYDRYSRYVGEAHFFMAYFYFNKVVRFGDVPWINKVFDDINDPDLYKKRDSRVDVIDSILNRLDLAIELLPSVQEVGNERMNKECALILKTRVSLFEGTWEKYHKGTPFAKEGVDPKRYFERCVEAGKELIKTAQVDHIGDEPYYNFFNQTDCSASKEVLFWRRYLVGYNAHNLNHALVTGCGRGITKSFVDSYLKIDGTSAYNLPDSTLSAMTKERDPRFEQTIFTPGKVQRFVEGDRDTSFFTKPTINIAGDLRSTTGYQLRKYENPYSINIISFNMDETATIIFRYPEGMLNLAEALAELGEDPMIDQTINPLRDRIGMAHFKSDFEDPNRENYGYSISNILYEIRRERRVELFGEYFRPMDLKRWRAHELFYTKYPKGYKGAKIDYAEEIKNGTFVEGKDFFVDENGYLDPYQQSEGFKGYNFRPNQDYLDPIPTNELTLNPNLQQNPGW